MTPRPLSLGTRLLGAILLTVAGTACSGVSKNEPVASEAPVTAPQPQPVASTVPAPTLMQQITAEVGSARCDSTAQCKTLAIGSKACGGPERYIAYSTKQSDATRLTRLASEDAAAKKAQNARSGMVSNCAMAMDPGATCSAGRCVTATGVGGDLPVR